MYCSIGLGCGSTYRYIRFGLIVVVYAAAAVVVIALNVSGFYLT